MLPPCRARRFPFVTDPVVEFILPVESAGIDLTRSTAGAAHGVRPSGPDLRAYALGGIIVSLPAPAVRSLPDWLVQVASLLDCVKGTTPGAAVSIPLRDALPQAGLTAIAREDGLHLRDRVRAVAVNEFGRAGVSRVGFPLAPGVALLSTSRMPLIDPRGSSGIGVRSWPQAATLPGGMEPMVEVSTSSFGAHIFRLRMAARNRDGLILVFQSGSFDLRGLQALSQARSEGRTTAGWNDVPTVGAVSPADLLVVATAPIGDRMPTVSEADQRLREEARRRNADQDIVRRAQLLLAEGTTPDRRIDRAFREVMLLHTPNAEAAVLPGVTGGRHEATGESFVSPDGEEFPIAPDGARNAPGYGTPPSEAARRGEKCSTCRYWQSAGDGRSEGYCHAWAFMAPGSAWCRTWEAR